jgi:hypothetical protein
MANAIFLFNSLGKNFLSFNREEYFKKMNQSETIIVLVHLAKRFQRIRLKCEKFTDDRRRTMDAK